MVQIKWGFNHNASRGKILRAEWEAISYKVNFDSNTGSGTMDKQTFVYDVEQKLAKNTYTKPGYQFEGWRTSAKSLTCDYLDEQTVKNLCTTHDDELTVYAVWRALDQTVVFDVNGGDPATKPKDIVQVTDSTVDLSTVKAPTRTGYTFAGWYEGATKAENSFVMPAGGKTLKRNGRQSVIRLPLTRTVEQALWQIKRLSTTKTKASVKMPSQKQAIASLAGQRKRRRGGL